MSRARSVSQLVGANTALGNTTFTGSITLSNSSINSTDSNTYVGSTTMTGGSQWFAVGGDYVGAEIANSHKLTAGKTYYKASGRLTMNLSGGNNNPTAWVLIVSHATGNVTTSSTITIVSGWKFRFPDGSAGDVFTFNFEDTLESFGSAKIPATGNYYIGWMHTTATGRGSLSGAYYTDYADDAHSNTVQWQSDPGPVGPRTITLGSHPSPGYAQGVHWRFFSREDYNVGYANTIKTDKIYSNHSLRINNKLAGVYELVNHTSWTSNTSAVYVAFQPELYSHYKLFWNISHGPSWAQTRLRFCDKQLGQLGSNHSSAGSWMNGTDASPTFNNTYFGHNIGYVWLAGNGVSWNSCGEGVIYTGDDFIYGLGVNRNAANAGSPGNRFPTVRGNSILYNNGDSTHYNESFSGQYHGTTPVGGFAIFGEGGASRLGSVWVYGARYE